MFQNIKNFIATLSHTLMVGRHLFRGGASSYSPLYGVGHPPHFRGVRKTGINGSLDLAFVFTKLSSTHFETKALFLYFTRNT